MYCRCGIHIKALFYCIGELILCFHAAHKCTSIWIHQSFEAWKQWRLRLGSIHWWEWESKSIKLELVRVFCLLCQWPTSNYHGWLSNLVRHNMNDHSKHANLVIDLKSFNFKAMVIRYWLWAKWIFSHATRQPWCMWNLVHFILICTGRTLLLKLRALV